MGSAMGRRLTLWEAICTMNYRLKSMGSMTVLSQAVMLKSHFTLYIV